METIARIDRIREFLKRAATDYSFLTKVEEGEKKVIRAIERGLRAVWANQTVDEQQDGTTRHVNGKGFNGRDASWAGILMNALERYGSLTDRQAESAAKMLAKYAGQIDAATATA